MATLSNNLVYLTYGQGAHVGELAFSIWSAIHSCRAADDLRIVVYTDTPQAVAHLPVHVEPLTGAALEEWAGPARHIHRRKILAIRDALTKFGGRVIYCDSDTYFYRSPEELFTLLRPGHSLMHLAEFHLADAPLRELELFIRDSRPTTRTGEWWPITGRTVMFNAGVVGMDESDVSLVDETLHLSDQIYPEGGLTRADDLRRHADQFAFSVCLQLRTAISQAHRVIYHYWSPVERALFRTHLDRVAREDPSWGAECFQSLWAKRPGSNLRARPFKSPVERGARAWIHRTAWLTARRLGVLQPLKRVTARPSMRSR